MPSHLPPLLESRPPLSITCYFPLSPASLQPGPEPVAFSALLLTPISRAFAPGLHSSFPISIMQSVLISRHANRAEQSWLLRSYGMDEVASFRDQKRHIEFDLAGLQWEGSVCRGHFLRLLTMRPHPFQVKPPLLTPA